MPLGSVCGGVYATIGDCTRFMILLLPSLIRLIQSIRLLFCGIDIGTHGGNAVKYFIAVAVVVLSALRFFYSESRTIFITWIIFCALNSVLCSIWDVLMDWDLRHFAEAFHVNSLNFWYQLLFGWKLAYIWAAGSNAILRCTLLWSYKLLKKSDKFVFMITTLEIFRRFQFTVFRVVKMWTQLPPADQGVQVPPPTEVPPQLPPADHGVQIPPPADHGVQVPPPAKVPPQLPPADHGVQVPPPSEVPPQLPPVDHGVQVPLPAEVPPQLPPADIPPPQPADNNAINQGGGENGGAQPIHHN
ncbi:hypothetical protein Ddye_017753 [Dipteronia dyeriana]|uniref:EXS domain-containing protein n=1 Tax=Dipteronia dyeriana TaxID=168575 RepID=A0AAD9X044_9ROSI|nr:hypothetical protein Ddye_017753 [Dipteronia dyeriana]